VTILAFIAAVAFVSFIAGALSQRRSDADKDAQRGADIDRLAHAIAGMIK
jgi:hypothetical protein